MAQQQAAGAKRSPSKGPLISEFLTASASINRDLLGLIAQCDHVIASGARMNRSSHKVLEQEDCYDNTIRLV